MDGGVEELTETQQSSHAPRSGPEVKNGSAKDGAPERLRCRAIQEEASQILQRVSTVHVLNQLAGLNRKKSLRMRFY